MAALMALAGLAGCAGAQGIATTGRRLDPAVPVAAVRVVDRLPRGHEPLGTVRALCTRAAPAVALRSAGDEQVAVLSLSAVACSERLLLGALREAAGRAGASELVGPRCQHGARAPDRGEAVLCAGGTATAPRAPGPRLESKRPPGSVPSGFVPPDASAAEAAPSVGVDAWQVEVGVRAVSPRLLGRDERAPEQVAELMLMPASQLPLAEVSVRCEGPCAATTPRGALLLVAGWLGADSVVDARCSGAVSERLCVATLGAYEVDPRQHRAAR